MLWNSSDLKIKWGLCLIWKLTLNLRNMEVVQRSFHTKALQVGTSRHSFRVQLSWSSLAQGRLLIHRRILYLCFLLLHLLLRGRNLSVMHDLRYQVLHCQALNHDKWCRACEDLREPEAPHRDTSLLYLHWNGLRVARYGQDHHLGRSRGWGIVWFLFRRRNSSSQWRDV